MSAGAAENDTSRSGMDTAGHGPGCTDTAVAHGLMCPGAGSEAIKCGSEGSTYPEGWGNVRNSPNVVPEQAE